MKLYTAKIPDITVNESELWVELPPRIEHDSGAGGARIRLYGSDNADRLRGLYFDGVVLDEYAQMHPRVWSEVVRPALADRTGWALFIGTPMGRNGFCDLFEGAQDGFPHPDGTRQRDPDWAAFMFKASETGIIPQKELEAAQRSMTSDQYAQEFECSFDAAIPGAYYAQILAEAEQLGRIRPIAHEPALPVHTGWDLGIGDPLPADTLEGGFDRAVMRDQQLKDANDRALTFPVTIDPDVSAVLPLPLAGQVLGWNGAGDALENKNLPAGTAVYSSTANTNLGASTAEAVTPKGLHDSIYNTDDTTVAITGPATAVTAGTAKETFRQPRKITLTAIRAALKTAQASGAILTVDVNVNGSSILSTKLTIDNGEKTSVTAATAAVISAATVNADDEITIDVDQIGDGTAAGLKVQFLARIEP